MGIMPGFDMLMNFILPCGIIARMLYWDNELCFFETFLDSKLMSVGEKKEGTGYMMSKKLDGYPVVRKSTSYWTLFGRTLYLW